MANTILIDTVRRKLGQWQSVKKKDVICKCVWIVFMSLCSQLIYSSHFPRNVLFTFSYKTILPTVSVVRVWGWSVPSAVYMGLISSGQTHKKSQLTCLSDTCDYLGLSEPSRTRFIVLSWETNPFFFFLVWVLVLALKQISHNKWNQHLKKTYDCDTWIADSLRTH